jgi:two-component sensor histidine kinase
MCIVLRKGLVLLYNDAFTPILGEKETPLGKRFDAVWPEAWPELEPLVAKAFQGEPTFIENFPLEVSRGKGPEQAYFTFSYSPLRNETGDIIGLVDTVIETTEAVKAKAEARLLSEELGHRLKNTLALVQAIASQTLAKASPRDAVQAFDARLIALSKAHDILLRESWTRARIGTVVDGVLSLHASADRFEALGPDLNLGPKGALSLAMLLHELATNAVKYGALSGRGGRVKIMWRVERGDVVLDWIESGGPLITPPTKKGIGSRLISSGLAGTGKVELTYPQSGFNATFRAPIAPLRES